MVWAPKAQIALANDLVTASLVLDEGSQSRAAIQAISDALISSALASDPTLSANVNAAAQSAAETAVDEQLTEAAVLTNAYVRAMPGRVFTVTDQKGNASFVDVDEQGKPTANAEALMALRRGVGFEAVDPASGWKLPFTDDAGRIAMGIRADDTFWAPGVVTVSVTEPPPPPPGIWGVWFEPNSDGGMTVHSQLGS